MTRLFCLSLIFALANSVHAQEKKDPPKNFTNSHRHEVRLDSAWQLHDGQSEG